MLFRSPRKALSPLRTRSAGRCHKAVSQRGSKLYIIVMVVCSSHFTSGQPLWAFSLSVQLHFTIDRSDLDRLTAPRQGPCFQKGLGLCFVQRPSAPAAEGTSAPLLGGKRTAASIVRKPPFAKWTRSWTTARRLFLFCRRAAVFVDSIRSGAGDADRRDRNIWGCIGQKVEQTKRSQMPQAHAVLPQLVLLHRLDDLVQRRREGFPVLWQIPLELKRVRCA